MNELLVLYDSRCAFCVRCRDWLESSAQLVPLRFLCCRSSLARERYGGIVGLGIELVVVDANGFYWVGPEAFSTCLWALDAGRGLSALLHWPGIWHVARAVFAEISYRRGWLGTLVGVPCQGNHCAVGAATSPYR